MKKTALILILFLIIFSGKAAAQCIGDLKADITGGSDLICFNTSPGTFTAVAEGESGSYTYLWYKDDVSTGITTQTYNPGNLTANTTVYCEIYSGLCGPEYTPKVSIIVVAYPTAPVIGTIIQPTCTVSTGSVALSGLPASGDWTVTISPGGATKSGNGTTTTIDNLSSQAYTFTVRNYAGCLSPSSLPATIQAQPLIPDAPIVGTITVPTCAVGTGSVVLNGLPVPGIWTLRRYPGSVTTTGSGATATISGLATGTYNFRVTNAAGCVSAALSDDVVIPAQPSSPSAPVITSITQPTCTVATGSVALSGLPSGTWIVTRSPGGITTNGSGTTTTIAGISQGTYTFTVAGLNGCISAPSTGATINAQPPTPIPPAIGSPTQPTCSVPTGSVVLNSLPSPGSWVVTRSPGDVTTSGSGTSVTIAGIDPGTYTFTVTNATGCTSGNSSNLVIAAPPPAPATPVYTIDCALGFGNAVITVTSPVGAGYQYSLDGGTYQTGTSFAAVANGNHIIAVRNIQGCTTVGTIFAVSCGCINPPLLDLSSETGSTCGTAPATVAGNTFGGSATSVAITENGAGSVNPSSATSAPFSFTYTPAAGDRGRIVTITVTTNNPLGSPCSAAVATYTLSVNAVPSPPSIGTITHLTCTIITGSIVLNGLPSAGTWTLTRYPDNIITSGTNSTTTITDLVPGTYSFIVTSEDGCTSVESAPAVVNPQPGSPEAPILGIMTQPTCQISTGSVELSGLPEPGNWILTRLPGGITRTGSGPTYTVPNVPSGAHTFTVTNASGCISPQSDSFTVIIQPSAPPAPSIGQITPPTCLLATGSVILLGLPAEGIWTLTRYTGGFTTTGSGSSDTIPDLPSGIYNFTVANESGCVSIPSVNVVIPAQPFTPSIPVVGTIEQPTATVPTGSVILSGLPFTPWILTRLPDEITTAGSGPGLTVSGLAGGEYFFTVTNSAGCISDSTDAVIISPPRPPDVIITDPPPACAPSKVDLTAPAVTEGSTGGLIYTYWTDAEATLEYATPVTAAAGTYYIKGTTVLGFFTIKPVIAAIVEMPVANAGPDQTLALQFTATMAAIIGENESGIWKVSSGTGIFADTTNPGSVVDSLSSGINIMEWIITNGACPADTDKVTLNVVDLVVPTLITPNGDPLNEYFVILGLSNLGKSELIVFDRRGARVFKNSDYDNKWNGVDYNENPLPNDTYFFVLNSSEGRAVKGYIVIRR